MQFASVALVCSARRDAGEKKRRKETEGNTVKRARRLKICDRTRGRDGKGGKEAESWSWLRFDLKPRGGKVVEKLRWHRNGGRHGEKHSQTCLNGDYHIHGNNGIDPWRIFYKATLMRSRIAQVRLRNACTCIYMTEGGPIYRRMLRYI